VNLRKHDTNDKNAVHHYLYDEQLWHVSTRIRINDSALQADMYNENCCKEAGYHNEETIGEVKLHKELRKALIHQTGMSKM